MDRGVISRLIAHQCGLSGCRVGEASNPGPVQTRQARRMDRLISEGDPSSDEEMLVRPNCGRHVVPRTALGSHGWTAIAI